MKQNLFQLSSINIASWTEKQTIEEWLASELKRYLLYYQQEIRWINENKLLLLLDGLDEVKLESRTKCVDAINQFRKEHGLPRL